MRRRRGRGSRRFDRRDNRRVRPAFVVVAAAVPLLLLWPSAAVHAQWRPTGALAAVPVVRDCHETGGDVAVSRLDPPTVYLCPHVVGLVRRKDPGAEHFYFVHEFGHVALQTSDEAAADCWAAQQLVNAPQGDRYLRIAVAHFRGRPNAPSPGYGTPNERADRIRVCAEEARPGTDAAPAMPQARPGRG